MLVSQRLNRNPYLLYFMNDEFLLLTRPFEVALALWLIERELILIN